MNIYFVDLKNNKSSKKSYNIKHLIEVRSYEKLTLYRI